MANPIPSTARNNPPHPTPPRLCWFLLIVGGAISAGLQAETPPLLAKAFEQWADGREDLAFTQQSRLFLDDGNVKEERLERYDPSLPDSRRWQLIEVDGRPATEEERRKWETKKNGKPRKKVIKAPAEYLDLEHAVLLGETPASARFEVSFRPEVARLIAIEKIAVVITVDRESGRVARIAATLRQPIRVLLGLARITDLDIDVRMELPDDDSAEKSGSVQTGSTARVAMSKLGNPMEYNWSDFKRVATFGRSKALD